MSETPDPTAETDIHTNPPHLSHLFLDEIRCTITDTGTYNSGGTISVAGWTIKVPQNAQVGFPAAWVPWRDFCADITFMRGFKVTVSHLTGLHV